MDARNAPMVAVTRTAAPSAILGLDAAAEAGMACPVLLPALEPLHGPEQLADAGGSRHPGRGETNGVVMRFGSLLMLALATLWAGAADAERVGSSTAQCRADQSTRARVLARLAPGTQVQVSERRGAWSRTAASRQACWVASRLLVTDDAQPGAATYLSTTGSRHASSATSVHGILRRHHGGRRAGAGPSRARRASLAARSRRGGAYSYGGSCPCGTGRICVGPRGGRYCITSGGNKEYGQ